MTPDGTFTRDDFRDAVGWMYAVMSGDNAAKLALARQCDPVGLVEAMSQMYAGLIVINTAGQPQLYLDFVRDNLDTMLDEMGLAR